MCFGAIFFIALLVLLMQMGNCSKKVPKMVKEPEQTSCNNCA